MKFISIFLISVLILGSITIISQVYADKVIQSFNMTEHEANNPNENNDYCYTSTCIIQRANEMMDKAETEAYWNNIKAEDYLNELDNLAKELERLD